MKREKYTSISAMIVLLILGIILASHPGSVLKTVARLMGVALIIAGAVYLLGWRKDRDRSVIRAGGAVLEILAGLILLAAPAFVLSLFPVLAGVVIVLYGIADVLSALSIRRNGGRWKTSLLLAVITVALGLLLLANPFSTMAILVRVLGLVLIYKSVTGIFIELQLR